MGRAEIPLLISWRDIGAIALIVGMLHAGAGAAVSLVRLPETAAELRAAYAGPPESWPRPVLH